MTTKSNPDPIRVEAERQAAGFRGMSGAQLKAAIEKLGMSQEGFGRHIGVGGRTVRGWIGEEFAVPKLVALYVRQLIKAGVKSENMPA